MPPAFAPQGSYKSGHRGLDVFSPVDQNGSFCFDRVIKSGKVNRRVKNKGAWKPSWKPAYLVLRPNLLSVYQNPDETDLKASITLSEVTAVARVKKTHTEHVFGVFSPSKNYHFQGISSSDIEDWIAQIKSEARTEDDDEVDLTLPRFGTRFGDPTNNYDSTDMSADEMNKPPGSPESRAARERARSALHSNRPRAHSNMLDYSGNEQYTTSHSDFSDTLSSSFPKHSQTSLSKAPVLTPIASSGQLTTATTPKQVPGRRTSPDHQTPDPERVIRHGHLLMLKSDKSGLTIRQGWKSVWLVLRPKSLSFYKSSDEYSPLKILDVNTIVNAAEVDPMSKSKRFCFQVITEERTLRFCCEGEEDLERWLGALKSVLRRRDEAEKLITAKKIEKGKSVADGMANLSLRAEPPKLA
jgi:hypothetical protein